MINSLNCCIIIISLISNAENASIWWRHHVLSLHDFCMCGGTFSIDGTHREYQRIYHLREIGAPESRNLSALCVRCYRFLLFALCCDHFYWYWSFVDDVWIDTLTSRLWPFMATCVFPLCRVLILINAWTSVIIGINRYIAVCRQLHDARLCMLCTISHARKQTACVVLFSFTYSLPSVLEYT